MHSQRTWRWVWQLDNSKGRYSFHQELLVPGYFFSIQDAVTVKTDSQFCSIMSTSTSPPLQSRPPVRRERLVASLQALLSNDSIDIDLFSPGNPWPNAGDVIEQHRPRNAGSLPIPCEVVQQHDLSTDTSTPTLPSACFKVHSAIDQPLPTELFHDDIFNAHDLPSWLGDLLDSSCHCRGPSDPAWHRCNNHCLPRDYASSQDFASFSSPYTTNPPCASYAPLALDLFPHGSLSGSGSGSGSQLTPWDIAMDEDGALPVSEVHSSSKGNYPTATVLPVSQRRHQDATAAQQTASKWWAKHHSTRSRQKRQRPHYVVEKRYRASLNERFEALRSCIQLRKKSPQQRASLLPSFSSELLQGETVSMGSSSGGESKMNKGEVLQEAVVYIEQLEEENEVVLEHLKLVVRRLRATKHALHQTESQAEPT